MRVKDSEFAAPGRNTAAIFVLVWWIASIIVFLLCLALPSRAATQNSSDGKGSATAADSSSSAKADSSANPGEANSKTSEGGAKAPEARASSGPKSQAEVNAAILQELERMRLRIAELEAQLKQQTSGGPPDGSTASSAQESDGGTSASGTESNAERAPNGEPAPNAGPEGAPVASTAARSTDTTPSAAAPAVAQPGVHETAKATMPGQTKQPKAEPFAFADFTWLNGNPRTKEVPLDTKFFTPEIRADVDYIYDFNRPADDTIGGSSEVFRAQEFQVTQLGVGGDFHYDNVQARLMTQFGMYSATTPRNDASPGRGNWDLDTAYRYISEAYGGYHLNVLHGINIQAGIFMSYIGLFSYYNFDNWAYQPSYVSSNTPWFFNGMRVQVFPTEHLKIEPWLINGWQSYGRFAKRPGFGAQILWRPTGWLELLGNQYYLGEDTLGVPGRVRYHTDDSLEIKYYDRPDNTLDKMAFSLTGDAGCEHGGGVSCDTNSAKGPKQSFLGFMFYNRWWFDRDRFGLTLGGGKINNPGRYLVLLPPINGATAVTGSPYFTENPGQPFKAWDATATFDYMPSQYITFRWEIDHRAANVPYFTGRGGITPPGGDTGAPGSLVCLPGFATCDGLTTNTWYPDLRRDENRLNMALLVKF